MINQYDTLHTVSVDYAIDAIKEHHELEWIKNERED